MATYNQVSYGSSGSDVEMLQKLLNSKGNYNLDEDGVFGDKTQQAVIAYQKANNLAVDGIVGNNTWGALTTPATTTPTETTTPTTQQNAAKQTTATTPTTTQTTDATEKPFSYEDFSYDDFSYGDYGESDIVNQAKALLDQQIASKPGAYQPVWQDEADAYLSQYQNRGPFSYDFNSDALYQQYKDNYIQQGQMAMMDTMGQAAALTGGYGNSYAQTAGQQAYNQQLSQLNDIMPELYQMALDKYNQEGQELLNMYNLYMDREAQEYGMYQDNLSNWYSDLEYLTNRYDSERDYDYGKWESDRSFAYDKYTSDRNYAYDQWSSNRDLAYDEYQNALNMAYQKERDAVADAQWQAEFDENKRQYDQSYALSAAQSSSSSSGGTGGVDDTGRFVADNISSMSTTEILGNIQSYSNKGDDQGLADFLDLCVAYGQMTDEMADYYYDKYKTDTDDDIFDTTVDLTGSGNRGGSGYGRARNGYSVNMIM